MWHLLTIACVSSYAARLKHAYVVQQQQQLNAFRTGLSQVSEVARGSVETGPTVCVCVCDS